MRGYTILQWLTFFMLYCIFGWCFESSYCSLKSGRLQNRGFCHGPWIPLYGVGACLLVFFAHGHEENLLYLFLLGFFGGTILELITGLLMNHIFHMRWWDYAQNPLNFHGYICFFASIGWGIMAIFLMRVVHSFVSSIPADWTYLTFVVMDTMLYTLFIEDVVFSVIAALELRERLGRLARNSEEIQNLRRSIGEIYERIGEAKQEWEQGAEELRNVQQNEGNVAAVKYMMESGMSLAKNTVSQAASSTIGTASLAADTAKGAVEQAASSMKESAGNLKESAGSLLRGLLKDKERMEEELAVLEDGGNAESGKMHWWTKTMLRNNPDAVSKEESFNALKEAALKKQKKESQAGTKSKK